MHFYFLAIFSLFIVTQAEALPFGCMMKCTPKTATSGGKLGTPRARECRKNCTYKGHPAYYDALIGALGKLSAPTQNTLKMMSGKEKNVGVDGTFQAFYDFLMGVKNLSEAKKKELSKLLEARKKAIQALKDAKAKAAGAQDAAAKEKKEKCDPCNAKGLFEKHFKAEDAKAMKACFDCGTAIANSYYQSVLAFAKSTDKANLLPLIKMIEPVLMGEHFASTRADDKDFDLRMAMGGDKGFGMTPVRLFSDLDEALRQRGVSYFPTLAEVEAKKDQKRKAAAKKRKR